MSDLQGLARIWTNSSAWKSDPRNGRFRRPLGGLAPWLNENSEVERSVGVGVVLEGVRRIGENVSRVFSQQPD